MPNPRKLELREKDYKNNSTTNLVPETPELADDQLSVTSGESLASSTPSLGVHPPASVEAAVYEVPSLLSQLVSGLPDEQVDAARKLHVYCRSGEDVQKAVVAEGGVHMLLIMLDSLDNTIRDLCTRTLTDLAADDNVSLDIASAPGGVSKVVQIMYKGVLEGQTSAGKFLSLLATSDQEAIQAACCHAKVVRLLTKTLSSTHNPKAMAGALGALQAFCRDPGNVSKMVWAGGVTALIDILQGSGGSSGGDGGSRDAATSAHTVPVLELLAKAAHQMPSSMQAACTPVAVQTLSKFIGSTEADLKVQALAAQALCAVAALPRKKEDALRALSDHALPRACEVVRSWQDSAAGGGAGPALTSHPSPPTLMAASHALPAEQQLLRMCAAIVAHLAQGSEDCCRVIVYHTASLQLMVAALVATRQCGLAQLLLQRALLLAQGPEGGVPAV